MPALPPLLEQHFRHPRNAGPAAERAWLGHSENSACGDWLQLGLECSQGVIARATFQARGCSATIACASLVTSELSGLPLADARRFEVAAAVARAGGLPPTSRHAIEVATRALAAALAQAGPAGHPLGGTF